MSDRINRQKADSVQVSLDSNVSGSVTVYRTGNMLYIKLEVTTGSVNAWDVTTIATFANSQNIKSEGVFSVAEIGGKAAFIVVTNTAIKLLNWSAAVREFVINGSGIVLLN